MRETACPCADHLSPSSSRVHDPEDDDPLWLPAVLDDVVSQVILTDVGRLPFGGMTNVRELLDEMECVVKNLVIDASLT